MMLMHMMTCQSFSSRNTRGVTVPHQEEGEEEGLLQTEGEKIFFFTPQREEGKIFFPQVASERRQAQEDEESGLLRDRHFINIDLRLRCVVRNF
jgi:hypothetical protein